MFVSTDLARRIEAAEASMLVALAERERATGAGDTVVSEPLGGGVAVFVRANAPMNKAIGLGFDGALDEERLAAVERAFAVRRAPLVVELATLASGEVARQLTQRGYELTAFENVLGVAPAGFAEATSAIRVDRGSDADLDAWIECLVDGFTAPDGSGPGTSEFATRDPAMLAEMRRSLHDFASAPGAERYFVRISGVMAGGACLRLAPGGIAQLCGAATLPAFRRRGIQSALLRARLRDAAAAGCDVAVTTTQPGSRSQQNAQKQGFALLYARAILVKSPPAEGSAAL